MPKSTPIRVMVSSRSKQPVSYKGNPKALLAGVRADLAAGIEQETLFGEPLFEVWINEPAAAAEGSENLWDECLSQVRKSDLLLVLYNGDAGWAKAGGEIGICHAELKEALNSAPAKVRIIQLDPLASRRRGADGERDDAFRNYVKQQYAFTGAPCRNGEEVIELCRKTLREAVAGMVKLGVREARKGKFYSGDALVWTRLDFRSRRREMTNVLAATLLRRGGIAIEGRPNAIAVPLPGAEVILVCSAISGPYAFLEAREGVNQLFLRDHEFAAELTARRTGPVHLIACQRAATEAQAVRQLGFPDATVVAAPFGVYVADNVQKMQLVFLANCRDPTTTAYQVQRLFDWIDQVGEGPLLVERAGSRSRIVRTIAAEMGDAAKRA